MSRALVHVTHHEAIVTSNKSLPLGSLLLLSDRTCSFCSTLRGKFVTTPVAETTSTTVDENFLAARTLILGEADAVGLIDSRLLNEFVFL